MDITVKQFEEDNRDLIEYWLDHARYKPTRNVEDHIPKKVDANCSRNFRRFALLRRRVQLLNHINLTNSKRIIDIGAGFGDFTLLAKYYNFEQLDATDPGIDQYKFLTTYMQDYYDNIYNLGIEDINLQGYDTAILSGLWIPNYREALEKYIFNTDIQTIVITTHFVNVRGFTEQKTIDFNPDPAPWKYNKKSEYVALGQRFLDIIMRGNGFVKDSSLDLIARLTPTCSKYILQYTRK